MKQTCILILGMHRSGTSALSGVLNILGVYLGTHLIQPKPENPKGFFENELIFEVNEDLLAQAGSSVHDDFFNETKTTNIHNIDKLKSALLEEFKYSKIFSIKDPRIGYLLPIYIQALKALDIEINVVVPIRNPLEVARSLQVRNGFSLEKGLLHWAYHFLTVEKFSRELPRVFTSFEELVQSPKDTINLIDQKLGLDLLKEYEIKNSSVHDFLTPELKHHTIAMENVSESLPKIIRDIICLIPSLNTIDVSEELDALRNQLFDYQALFYNSSITSVFDDFVQIKEALTVKDHELFQAKQGLQAKDQALEGARQELQSKERELLQASQELQDKAQVLEYAKKGLQAKDQLLEQAQEGMQSKDQALEGARQELQSKERELLQASQELQDKAQVLEYAKKELQVKDQLLEQAQQGMQAKEQALKGAREELQSKEKELLQARQVLQEREQVLEYVKQDLQVKDQLLEEAQQEALASARELQQSRQKLQSINQALEHTQQKLQASDQELRCVKQSLHTKEQALQLQAYIQAQAFNNIQGKILELNSLKGELLNIYKSRSWRITRTLRKIKRKLGR